MPPLGVTETTTPGKLDGACAKVIVAPDHVNDSLVVSVSGGVAMGVGMLVSELTSNPFRTRTVRPFDSRVKPGMPLSESFPPFTTSAYPAGVLVPACFNTMPRLASSTVRLTLPAATVACTWLAATTMYVAPLSTNVLKAKSAESEMNEPTLRLNPRPIALVSFPAKSRCKLFATVPS